jgi:hypothetical protein
MVYDFARYRCLCGRFASFIPRQGTPDQYPMGCTRGRFGVIVLPLALWLYAQFFTDPLRALFLGFPGPLLLLHFSPFQDAGVVSHEMVENTAAGVSSVLRSAFLVGSVLCGWFMALLVSYWAPLLTGTASRDWHLTAGADWEIYSWIILFLNNGSGGIALDARGLVKFGLK